MKTLYINGVIGYDFKPETIINFLSKTKANEPIAIVLNTPGGDVLDGFEIRNILNDYKGQKTVIFNSFVASMGSYIGTLPGAKIIGRDNTVFMIHNVWGLAIGDHRDIRRTSDIYEAMTDIIAASLAEKTKKKKEEVRKCMDAESWYFAEELLNNGFVDEVVPSGQPIEGIEYSNDAEKSMFFFFDSADKTERINKSKLAFELSNKYSRTKEFNIEKAAALCYNKAALGQDKKPDIILQEAKIMNFKEFLDSNPQALKEYNDEITKHVSEAIVNERKNVSELIDVSGLTCIGQDNNTSTQSLEDFKTAITCGLAAGDYAVALVKKQKALRMGQQTNNGTITNVNSAVFNMAEGEKKQAAVSTEKKTVFDLAVEKDIADQKALLKRRAM